MPAEVASAETNASNNSLPDDVLNAGVVMLVAAADRSLQVVASMAIAPHAGDATSRTRVARNTAHRPANVI